MRRLVYQVLKQDANKNPTTVLQLNDFKPIPRAAQIFPADDRIDGKPIRQIFDNQEMLISTFQPKMVPATLPTANGG